MTLRMDGEIYMLLKAKTVQAWCKEHSDYMIHSVHVYIEITEHNNIGRECRGEWESSVKPCWVWVGNKQATVAGVGPVTCRSTDSNDVYVGTERGESLHFSQWIILLLDWWGGVDKGGVDSFSWEKSVAAASSVESGKQLMVLLDC